MLDFGVVDIVVFVFLVHCMEALIKIMCLYWPVYNECFIICCKWKGKVLDFGHSWEEVL